MSAFLPGPADPLPGVRIILGRIGWVLAGGMLGLLLGGAVSLLRPPVYTSTAFLSVTSTSTQDAGKMARMAQAFARVASAPGVVAGPLRVAGLQVPAENPRKSITAQAAPDAPVFSVSGRDADPEVARRIAAVASASLTGLQDLGPFRAVVVAAPTTPSAPVTPRWVPAAGGLILGLGVATVLAATVPGRSGAPKANAEIDEVVLADVRRSPLRGRRVAR
jgi:hypothetical protein